MAIEVIESLENQLIEKIELTDIVSRGVNMNVDVLVFGVQEYPCRANEYRSEYSTNRVDDIAGSIAAGAQVGIDLPEPKIVIVEGSPVVIDGHHTVRAVGKLKAQNIGNGQVQVTVYDAEQFLNKVGGGNVGIGKLKLIKAVNQAKSTLIANLREKGSKKQLTHKTFVSGLLET